MPPVRTCAECGKPLGSRSVRAKTCSNACRLRRSRRIRRTRTDFEQLESQGVGAAEISAIVRRESPDVITRVMKEELAPIVREALTEDVLRAVQQMLGLTPRAVELLQLDLESPDATIRQRAYTLVTKYTIGHPALLKADDADGSKQIVVNFGLPRPDDVSSPGTEDTPAEAVELQVCDMCNEEKSAGEFVAGSTRCQDCFAKWRTAIMDQFT